MNAPHPFFNRYLAISAAIAFAAAGLAATCVHRLGYEPGTVSGWLTSASGLVWAIAILRRWPRRLSTALNLLAALLTAISGLISI